MANKRRRLKGTVTRAKMEKTINVQVDRTFRHPLYGKVMHTSKNYLVHDELGCRTGDQVVVVESRPVSRRKRWVVESIIRRISETELAAEVQEAEEGEGLPDLEAAG